MYYIPTLEPESFSYNKKQLIIVETKEFKELFTLLRRSEKVVFKGQTTLLQYNYYFKLGIDDKPIFSISVDKNGDILDSDCIYCYSSKQCHHRYQIIKDLSAELSEEAKKLDWVKVRNEYILEKEEEEKARLAEEKLIQKRNKSLTTISSLLTNLNEQDYLPLQKPVKIYPSLNIFKAGQVDLEIKVGIDKLYVIKSITTFFDNILNKNEVTYGKNLSFVHNINNFDLPSQKFIQLLMDYRSKKNYYDVFKYDNSTMRIDLYTLEQIFLIYKNQNVDFNHYDINGGTYFVALEQIDIGFSLDKKYTFKLINSDNSLLLDCKNNVFLFKNNQINLASFPNENMRHLYDFITSHPNFSFKHIQDILNKEILSRYFDYIQIDKDIKDKIDFKKFIIKTYFDYEDEKIKVNTKYLYGDNQISDEEMKSHNFSSIQIDKYHLYLQQLGVENDVISNSSKIFQFFRTDLSDFKKVATVYLSERIVNVQTRIYKPFNMKLNYNTGMLSVCFEESSYSNEELSKIIKGLRKKTKYIKLNKNTIIEIDEENAERLLNTINELNLNINTLTTPQAIPLFQVFKAFDQSINLIGFNKLKQLEELISDVSNYKNADFNVPTEVASILRTYQKEAFLWMKTLIKYQFSGILADDMGLGKSLEMISVILSDQTAAPTLIVCPKSLCYNWKNEFYLWAPNMKVVNIIGSINQRKELIDNIKANERCIYITSYDSLRSDSEDYKDILFQYMVLDEAQFIKNQDTLKAQSVKKINSKLRFVLTGTPIENTVLDLWSIFDFLMPGYLGDYKSFKSKYERSIIERKDNSSIRDLVYRISPFILRRTKQDVIKDLPDKIELIQTAKMSDEQRKIYEAELKRTRDIIENSDNKIEILACLTRLRQVCVDPGMYLENYKGGSGKVSIVSEIIEEYISKGSRILLFSQFTSIFPSIEKILQEKNISYYILTGKTKAVDRVDMATDFNTNDDRKVFLISLKAGGTGLNLIGADIVIHLDPWWNIAAENQATDRAHRIGQNKIVQVIKLICEDSIEQKVIELQERKREIVKLIINDDDSNILKLSKEDLNYLISK